MPTSTFLLSTSYPPASTINSSPPSLPSDWGSTKPAPLPPFLYAVIAVAVVVLLFVYSFTRNWPTYQRFLDKYVLCKEPLHINARPVQHSSWLHRLYRFFKPRPPECFTAPPSPHRRYQSESPSDIRFSHPQNYIPPSFASPYSASSSIHPPAAVRLDGLHRDTHGDLPDSASPTSSLSPPSASRSTLAHPRRFYYPSYHLTTMATTSSSKRKRTVLGTIKPQES